MKATITYIHHNCFILKESSRTFLFDYPGEPYLTPRIRESVTNELRGSKALIFVSHSHQDHFNPKIVDLAKLTAKAGIIISDDILKSHPRLEKVENCLSVKPEAVYVLDELKITTFPSNDLGVAYLIQTGNLTIYFGGDLAKWSWDDFTPKECRRMEEHFQKTIDSLAKHRIDIAFENTDSRLANWAGAADFIKAVKPGLFVPMHTFGDLDSLERFVTELGPVESKIFQYRETGAKIEFSIPFL